MLEGSNTINIMELEGVGIMAQVWSYGTGVVLDGNLLWYQILVQALRK